MKKFFTGLWIGVVTALAVVATFFIIKSRKNSIDFMADDAVMDIYIRGSAQEYEDALVEARKRITESQAAQVKAEFMARFGVKS